MEIDWKRPDYTAIYKARAERLGRIRKEPALLLSLKLYYKDHPADFINDWGMTFDPRMAEIGLQPVMPFVLFQKQREFIDWLHARWLAREDGLAEKSRDMGVSWLCVGFGVWMWLFHSGSVVGYGSRKEEYVDKIGDPKSLFWKAREFVNLLPKELRPKGYDQAKHSPHMRIINPENGAAMVGEAGDNIGRGNRTSIYFKDESAFYEHPEAIDAALSQTSNCKIDVSTPNGNGNPFYRKRMSGRVPVFVFDWRDDPRKDEAWYKTQCDRLDPVVVAQEIDRNYDASASNAYISGQLVTAAQAIGPAQIDVMGLWIVSIDAAHEGDDESVINMRRGRLNLPQVSVRGVRGDQLAARVQEECERLIPTAQIGAIIIELDGPGVSCYDHLKNGKFSHLVVGIHTGARQKSDRDYNLRASLWRGALEWLSSPPCSLPVDPELKAQLASVRYKYKDGLLLMQSKKEYKALFNKSPDRADAFVIGFAPFTPQDAKANYTFGSYW